MSFLKNGVLVVAHPDDEILFFSSIMDEISTLIICFSKVPNDLNISHGRKKAIAQFPLKNVNLICLDINESKPKNPPLNWINIKESEFGVRGGYDGNSYKQNYILMKKKLNNFIHPNNEVITHNPWGEYGNAEHIQIFKVIFDIAKEKKIKMFVNGYFSNLTISYSKRKQYLLNPSGYYLRTNKNYFYLLRQHYLLNSCWTWSKKYKPPSIECFYKVDLSNDFKSNLKSDFESNLNISYPLNYIELRHPYIQYIRDLIKNLIPVYIKKLINKFFI